MFEQDVSPVQAAHDLRVSTKSAYQWRRCWRAGGRAAPASAGPGGAVCRLSPVQQDKLRAALDGGSAAWGWDEDQRWTLARARAGSRSPGWSASSRAAGAGCSTGSASTAAAGRAPLDVRSRLRRPDRRRAHPVACPGRLDLGQSQVRHEALLLRMEVKDRPSPCRRSGGVKLEAAWPGGRWGGREQPRRNRVGSALPDGPGAVSETGAWMRCAPAFHDGRGTSVRVFNAWDGRPR